MPNGFSLPTASAPAAPPAPRRAVNPFYVLLLALIVAIGGYAAFIRPAWSDYQAGRTQLTTARTELSQRQKDRERAQKLTSEFAALPANHPDLARIMRALPVGKQFEELLVSLEGIAFGSGLKLNLSSVRFQDAAAATTGSGPVRTVSFSLDIVGDSSALGAFLERIEQNLRLVDVQSLRVSGGDDPALQRVLLTARTYYLDEGSLL